ncbi:ShlB/FhaC/HecB family hemolysin secretion/activation protein [Herbaspirillum sp. RV1423]|uniref:ShlB/FhaC/HecB family hemolysin secretion/activation protein n=1 Tax=Herbaspirillum sp. RV1423 TaxID=1443993 RepID=UPI0004B67091|nr:POTRA domain-containing protein [Herbaspirillum sp. RV1423]
MIQRTAVLLLPGVLALVNTPLRAQTIPDAGRLLNDARPLPALPGPRIDALPEPQPAEQGPTSQTDVHFNVVAFHFEGVSAFSEAQLQDLLADLRGSDRTLATLSDAVARVTYFYRQHGYLLARAYLPEQHIDSGNIEIHVLEGRLGDIRLHNSSGLSDADVRRRLERIGMDQVLRKTSLESSLLLLSDIPGIVVRSALMPGAAVGATDLDVTVSDGSRVDADVGIDNYGNRYTGQYHVSGNLALNNPSGIGDQLQINLMTSGREFNYGRVAWQLPVNDVGTRVGVAYASMAYRLGEDFSALDAHGTARIGSIFLTHPLVRSRSFNLNGQLRFENKVLVDRIDLISDGSEKHLNNFTIGIFGDATDGFNGGAQSQGSVSVTVGNLKLDRNSADLDAAGHRSQGSFIKGSMQWARLQRLDDANRLLVQLSGQVAGGNLDSAEKISLGGPYGVRAYPSGEAPSDDALMLNLEWRRSITSQWQALLFGDLARGRLNHSPIAADGANLRTLSGIGLGASWTHPDGYRLQATLSWRTDGAPTAERDRMPRLWMQFSKSF